MPSAPQRQTTSEFPRCDLTTASWPPTRRPADGQQKGPGVSVPVVLHTHADAALSVLSDGAYDTLYGAGVDPARVPRSSMIDFHQGKD